MTGFELGRLPTSDDELWNVVRLMWGVSIPRERVCPDHVAPFTAFADAYFRRNSLEPNSAVQSLALWHGSRGLSGKSFMLAILGLTVAHLLGSDVNLLGGSLAQSTNIHQHMRAAMEYVNAPRYMVTSEGMTEIKLSNRARIRPLTASQRTVRGPHPATLLLDEIDEMELAILDAALGQPMPQTTYLGKLIKPYTVMCSTWQNPEGCVVFNTPVVTDRGTVPIQEVRIGDLVPTRSGWRTVTNVIDTGVQECVTVDFQSGRRLTCTPWHPVWTGAGWVEASRLAPGAHVVAHVRGVGRAELPSALIEAHPTASLHSTAAGVPHHDGPLQRQVVPVAARRLGHLDGKCAGVVDLSGDRFAMSGIHARPTCTSTLADVIERPVARDGPVDPLPHPAVGQMHSFPARVAPVGFVPVAVLTDMERPQDALVGVQIDDYTFAQDEVVQVHHEATVLPTWDLTVADTHEYVADGILVHNTFTEIKRRAEERGIPTYAWCFLETSAGETGWLSQDTIEEKRQSIPAEMWRVEYELGEPAIGNRAFDTAAVDAAFAVAFDPAKDPAEGGYLRKKISKDFEEYTFAEYDKQGDYVAGADWGKEQDKTVIWAARIDGAQRELVYYLRVNRRPYPLMIGWYNAVLKRYDVGRNGAWHDSTGLGNVVNDYLDIRARPFPMTGEKRAIMLSDYVNAIEKGTWKIPRIKSAYLEMKYCRVGDLYSSRMDFHLPDSVCAAALAEYAAKRSAPIGLPILIGRDSAPTKLEAQFAARPGSSEERLLSEPPISLLS